MWDTFTNIGDASLTLPVALLCAAWLARSNPRLGLLWLALLAAGMALVGATKIANAGWGLNIGGSGFRMISGHAMLSTAVWTLVAALLLRRRGIGEYLAMPAGLALGALTGLARVFDGSHSMSEVVAGWLLGALIAALFLRASRHATLKPLSSLTACVGLVLVSTLAYGHHAPFQEMIVAHSPAIRTHVMKVMPAIRADLRR